MRPVGRLSVIVVIAALLIACGEDPDPDSSDDYERPDETRDMITDAQIDELLDVGAVIHDGDNPPNIAGVYDRAGGTVEFDDNEDNIGLTLCYSMWTVEETDQENLYTTSSESYHNCSGSSEGTASYISGSGDCFTLFSASDGEREGCEFSGVSLVSGCLDDDGISDYRSAGFAFERPGDACQSLIDNNKIPAEGDRTVSDRGFVERVE